MYVCRYAYVYVYMGYTSIHTLQVHKSIPYIKGYTAKGVHY